jgi:ketosteroid isomerase-like protein
MPDGNTGPLIERVERMMASVASGNWDEWRTYMHPDLFYKVGAAEPVHSAEAARQFMLRVADKLKVTSHDVRGTFQVGNIVVIEMDANYLTVQDGRPVTVPCCDVYRFDGDLIREWRVYPDASNVRMQI